MPPGIGYRNPRMSSLYGGIEDFAQATPKADRAQQRLDDVSGLGGAVRDFAMAHPKDDRNQTQPVGNGARMEEDWTAALSPSAGSWNENFEWTPSAGGPQIGDLLGSVGDTSRLTGFNTQGWGSGERGTESEKNAVGMILSRIDPSQPGAIDAFLSQPEVAQFWPDAQKVGFDKVDLDGPGPRQPVDLLRNASASSGAGDAWQYLVPGSGGGSAAAPAGPMGDGSDLLAQLLGGGIPQSSDLLQRIQAELQKQLTGQPETAPMVDPLMELI